VSWRVDIDIRWVVGRITIGTEVAALRCFGGASSHEVYTHAALSQWWRRPVCGFRIDAPQTAKCLKLNIWMAQLVSIVVVLKFCVASMSYVDRTCRTATCTHIACENHQSSFACMLAIVLDTAHRLCSISFACPVANVFSFYSEMKSSFSGVFLRAAFSRPGIRRENPPRPSFPPCAQLSRNPGRIIFWGSKKY
jgi:hypothetical protein